MDGNRFENVIGKLDRRGFNEIGTTIAASATKVGLPRRALRDGQEGQNRGVVSTSESGPV